MWPHWHDGHDHGALHIWSLSQHIYGHMTAEASRPHTEVALRGRQYCQQCSVKTQKCVSSCFKPYTCTHASLSVCIKEHAHRDVRHLLSFSVFSPQWRAPLGVQAKRVSQHPEYIFKGPRGTTGCIAISALILDSMFSLIWGHVPPVRKRVLWFSILLNKQLVGLNLRKPPAAAGHHSNDWLWVPGEQDLLWWSSWCS